MNEVRERASMRKDDIEQRTLTPKFPNLSITDGKAVFTMEVDTTTLNKEGKYAGGVRFGNGVVRALIFTAKVIPCFMHS